MTQVQIAAIVSPANGLTVFSTDDNRFYYYDDGAGEWKEIAVGEGTITPTWDCGDVLVDSRDGKSYNTVPIGTQCWMAENLNVGSRIDGVNNQTDNSILEKYCYDNNTANCEIYGGLYQWNEMMQYVNSGGSQGICPDGWHLPTDTEWITLTDYLGGTGVAGGKMKEDGTTHWYSNTGATNSSGFTVLPGGRQYPSIEYTFDFLSYYAYFWSSSENDSNAWKWQLYYYNTQVDQHSVDKSLGFSVRCVRD
jgi:uncharacterized protein (TIGR02145 family)